MTPEYSLLRVPLAEKTEVAGRAVYMLRSIPALTAGTPAANPPPPPLADKP